MLHYYILSEYKSLREVKIFRAHIIRKNLMSVIFPPAILRPEMAAPSLWAPGIFWFFLLENRHAHEILRLSGGGVVFFGRGAVEANFNFMGVGIFPKLGR